MSKFHISPDGEPRSCSAQPGNCKYGADYPHFNDKQDARKAYELVMAASIQNSGWGAAPENPFKDMLKKDRQEKLTNSIKNDLEKAGIEVALEHNENEEMYVLTLKTDERNASRTLDRIVRNLDDDNISVPEYFKPKEGYSEDWPTVSITLDDISDD